MTRLVLLGVVTGAHGIRGEVKVKSFTSDPKAIASYGVLQTASGSVIEIIKIRPAKDEFICTLKTVADRNQAEALRGTELFVDRAQLPKGETLLSDLVGRTVTQSSSVLGTITGFQNFGAGELMELDTGLLIPVRFMTSEAVTVDLPDGFLDTEE
jgi:16S rRNA processing protein RimM